MYPSSSRFEFCPAAQSAVGGAPRSVHANSFSIRFPIHCNFPGYLAISVRVCRRQLRPTCLRAVVGSSSAGNPTTEPALLAARVGWRSAVNILNTNLGVTHGTANTRDEFWRDFRPAATPRARPCIGIGTLHTFQACRWLSDIAPHLLSAEARQGLAVAKRKRRCGSHWSAH